MKKRYLTNAEILTCKELVKDKMLGLRLEIMHCEMYKEEAEHKGATEVAQKQNKAMIQFEKELEPLQALYAKFEEKKEIK